MTHQKLPITIDDAIEWFEQLACERCGHQATEHHMARLSNNGPFGATCHETSGCRCSDTSLRHARPRMTEPGWGEKVWAHTEGDTERRRFVCWHSEHPTRWAAETNGHTYPWLNLIDPEPIP